MGMGDAYGGVCARHFTVCKAPASPSSEVKVTEAPCALTARGREVLLFPRAAVGAGAQFSVPLIPGASLTTPGAALQVGTGPGQALGLFLPREQADCCRPPQRGDSALLHSSWSVCRAQVS